MNLLLLMDPPADEPSADGPPTYLADKPSSANGPPTYLADKPADGPTADKPSANGPPPTSKTSTWQMNILLLVDSPTY